MAIDLLHHVSIRTTDVPRSVAFYSAALGLATGPRPPFDFPGAWLYRRTASGEVTGHGIVHIIGIDSARPQGVHDYLGDRAPSGPGTGAFDHVAFAASGIDDVRARLVKAGIAFRERLVPQMNLRQIFVEDPDGVTVELNFAES